MSTFHRKDVPPVADSTDAKTDKLAKSLKHAITMERKAVTRVQRSATVLKRWQTKRARIERSMAAWEVQRIVNRLSLKNEDIKS
jgi:phage terminase Nu1 subunit (DNA packaging protein)